jgi:hypothetical protein
MHSRGPAPTTLQLHAYLPLNTAPGDPRQSQPDISLAKQVAQDPAPVPSLATSRAARFDISGIAQPRLSAELDRAPIKVSPGRLRV